jgi:hypothetical protein
MILVMSLLEQRRSDQIVKRIMRSLPMDVLKRNIAKIYKRYKKLYGDKYIPEALGHVRELNFIIKI